MCGIAGIIQRKTDPSQQDEFGKCCALMSHRGPDYCGSYRQDKIALFHYRLSILDLDSRANQPFYNSNRNKVLVYNGEVYNFRELARIHGISMQTTSDTEVVLSCLDKSGTDSLDEWNGIFAFAFYDENKKELTLTRDRFGVKPLYIYQNDDVFLFASEAKVILTFLQSFDLHPQALAEYLYYGNPLGGQSIIRGLHKLGPATCLTIELPNMRRSVKKFWSLETNHDKGRNDSFGTAVQKTRVLLEEAIKGQLVSDVPLGVFLSGGIDSSAITAFASKHISGKLNTYSVEYDYNKGGTSELPKARLIAKLFNTDHHEMKVESGNIPELFEEMVYQYDEPFADAASIPLFQLAKRCGGRMRVVLQGDGGDELFAGYRTYMLLNRLKFWQYATRIGAVLVPDKLMRERLRRKASNLNQPSDALRMALLMTETMTDNYPANIFSAEWRQRVNAQDPFRQYYVTNEKFARHDLVQRMLYTDMEILLPATYLEKVDKATMRCSLEARVPFLDNNLSSYVLGLPASYKVKGSQKKYLLRKALAGIVPSEILNAPKRGFDMPYKQWLKTSMYDYAHDKINSFNDNIGMINRQHLLKLLDEHKRNVKDHGALLWKSLVLVAWLERYHNKLTDIPYKSGECR